MAKGLKMERGRRGWGGGSLFVLARKGEGETLDDDVKSGLLEGVYDG